MKLKETSTIQITSAPLAKMLELSGYPIEKEKFHKIRKDGRKSGSRSHYVLGKFIEVKVSDLPQQSHVEVDVECEKCAKEFKLRLDKYSYMKEKDCPECERAKHYTPHQFQNTVADIHSNIVDEPIELIVLSPKICGYYESLGYVIPKEKTEKIGKSGKKKGFRDRYILGSVIKISPKHLSVGSHNRIKYTCANCGEIGTTTYNLYVQRQTDFCPTCAKKENGKLNSRFSKDVTDTTELSISQWKKIVLTDNPDAKCDITGETDKRFLIVHHLVPRNMGGLNTKENAVILSAQYHQAFHSQYGHNVGIKEYEEFKHAERLRLNIG